MERYLGGRVDQAWLRGGVGGVQPTLRFGLNNLWWPGSWVVVSSHEGAQEEAEWGQGCECRMLASIKPWAQLCLWPRMPHACHCRPLAPLLCSQGLAHRRHLVPVCWTHL